MFLLTLRSIRTLPYGDVFQAFPSINEQLVLSIHVYIIQKLHSSETNNTSDTRITHICMCMCTAACVYCIVIVFVSLIFYFFASSPLFQLIFQHYCFCAVHSAPMHVPQLGSVAQYCLSVMWIQQEVPYAETLSAIKCVACTIHLTIYHTLFHISSIKIYTQINE